MDRVWEHFYHEYAFRPSVYAKDWPSVQPKGYHLKLDISACFGTERMPACEARVEEFAKTLFLRLTRPGDRLIALDWQHECFDFDPRQGWSEEGAWTIPVFPDGDYYIFLTPDLANIWFGHPWEQSVTLLGEGISRLADALKDEFGDIFREFAK